MQCTTYVLTPASYVEAPACPCGASLQLGSRMQDGGVASLLHEEVVEWHRREVGFASSSRLRTCATTKQTHEGAAHRAHPAQGAVRVALSSLDSRVASRCSRSDKETRSCWGRPALGLCNRHAARRDRAAAGPACVLCESWNFPVRQTKGGRPQPFTVPCCMRAFIFASVVGSRASSLGRSGRWHEFTVY